MCKSPRHYLAARQLPCHGYGMLFGRRKDSVATPLPDPPAEVRDTVATPSKLELVQPDARQLERLVSQLHDDLKWLSERFEKLQNRVTTELREIRREVDRFYDEPEEE